MGYNEPTPSSGIWLAPLFDYQDIKPCKCNYCGRTAEDINHSCKGCGSNDFRSLRSSTLPARPVSPYWT